MSAPRFAMTALIGFVALTASCHSGTINDGLETPFAITRVLVQVGAADVDIAPTAGGVSTVALTLDWQGAKEPAYLMDVQGTTLRVKADCLVHCNGQVRIAAPAAARLDVDNGTGNLHARKMSGAAFVTLAAGTLSLEEMSGSLELTTGAGRIEGTGLKSARCNATAASGDVTLTFFSSPESVRIETTAGAVALTLPPGEYNISSATKSGDTQVAGVANNPASLRTVRVTTDSGNIFIAGVAPPLMDTSALDAGDDLNTGT